MELHLIYQRVYEDVKNDFDISDNEAYWYFFIILWKLFAAS